MIAERKKKEDRPVLAICYDFDKTLSPDDMQAQGYIQSVYGRDINLFWKECNELAEENEMDSNLAYMYKMISEAYGKIVFNKDGLKEFGSKVKLFPGVEGWFERIRNYGAEKGVIVEHYIISSGLKEMIEGTSVAHEFEKIYASSFMFDSRGVAIWPAQVVNYTNKTQFLFRIEKGILDVNDSGINDYFAPEDIRVPFRNIVYIGDSDTDIPCMKLVNSYGGHSIAVFNSETSDKTKVYKMIRDNRVKYFVPADYKEGSELDNLMKVIIDRTAYNEILENIHFECKKERERNDIRKSGNEEKRRKLDLILSLDGSGSFATTHTVISELRKFDDWDNDEAERLIDIAVSNSQVYSILNDKDISEFYHCVIAKLKNPSDKSKKITDAWDKNGESSHGK